jgi:quinol monooxygenase YgiN
MKAEPGKGDELAKRLGEMFGDTRDRDGCLSILLVRDQTDPDRLVIVERWASSEDHHAYQAWRAARGDGSALAGVLAGASTHDSFDELDV